MNILLGRKVSSIPKSFFTALSHVAFILATFSSIIEVMVGPVSPFVPGLHLLPVFPFTSDDVYNQRAVVLSLPTSPKVAFTLARVTIGVIGVKNFS